MSVHSTPNIDLSMLLSCQRDVYELERTLAVVVAELLKDIPYRLYINSDKPQPTPFYLLSSNTDNFSANNDLNSLVTLNTKENALVDDDDAYFPAILNEKVYACVITPSDLSAELSMQLLFLLTIFCNIYSFIEDSIIDPLTGLANRRHFINELHNELVKPTSFERRKDDAHLSSFLVIIDIDHFKQVNDSYGHLIGDEVLLTLANLIKESFREQDGLFRYGGEEFAVVLKDLTESDCEAVLQRFAETVRNKKFPTVNHITVSMGVCNLKHTMNPIQAIDYADKALYFSKQHGRDQLSNYNLLIEQGKLQELEVVSDIELF